jgi:hypothetical protein
MHATQEVKMKKKNKFITKDEFRLVKVGTKQNTKELYGS